MKDLIKKNSSIQKRFSKFFDILRNLDIPITNSMKISTLIRIDAKHKMMMDIHSYLEMMKIQMNLFRKRMTVKKVILRKRITN